MNTCGVFLYSDFAKPAKQLSIPGVLMRHMVRISVALLLMALLVGCGPKRPKIGAIEGTITYKGRPVNDASLTLYPTGGSASDSITIGSDREGKFRIADVPPGNYKMTVQGTEGSTEANPMSLKNVPPEKRAEMEAKLAAMNTPPTIPFPNKYKDLRTSDLTCTITDKDQTLNLELKD
jgi:hypothetical protein